MVEASLKTWIVSFDELKVLLYSLGFTKNEGILMDEKTFSENEVLRILYGLTRKELMFIEEESFQIIPDLKKSLMIMGNPERTEIITGADGREYYCYIRGEEATVSDRYWPRKDAVRISPLDLSQYLEWRKNIT